MTYQGFNFLFVSVVEQELCEVGLRVGRLHSESLCKTLGENLGNVGLLKVGDLGHVAPKQLIKSGHL